ncbi:MAG TPA: acyl carrier protein [Dongiaceae bacterium]|nr:acyl carrier protein [Dongiaceae bacterium]
MDTKQRIREFVTTNFFVQDAATLTDDASLLDIGVVDSTGVLEIIGFLEGTFGLAVEDDEIVPDNLDSIERIAAFVGRKQAAAGA